MKRAIAMHRMQQHEKRQKLEQQTAPTTSSSSSTSATNVVDHWGGATRHCPAMASELETSWNPSLETKNQSFEKLLVTSRWTCCHACIGKNSAALCFSLTNELVSKACAGLTWIRFAGWITSSWRIGHDWNTCSKFGRTTLAKTKTILNCVIVLGAMYLSGPMCIYEPPPKDFMNSWFMEGDRIEKLRKEARHMLSFGSSCSSSKKNVGDTWTSATCFWYWGSRFAGGAQSWSELSRHGCLTKIFEVRSSPLTWEYWNNIHKILTVHCTRIMLGKCKVEMHCTFVMEYFASFDGCNLPPLKDHQAWWHFLFNIYNTQIFFFKKNPVCKD